MPPSNPNHESAIFAAELGDAPTIDLHGMNADTAIHDLDEYLNREFMHGTLVIKIIHGRGTATLQRAVTQHLRSHPLVDYFRGAESPSQSGAVTYAALARRTPR
jgi:DNA mismatch repair protein MutS2